MSKICLGDKTLRYFIKRKLTFILFSFCLAIILSQIVYGIYNNFYLKNKTEKIIASVDTYSFFNLVNPSKENLKDIKEFKNILPLKCRDNYEEGYIKSKILEIIDKKLNIQSKIDWIFNN